MKLVTFKGSPPLTWRTLPPANGFPSCFRITSTYVENTISEKLIKNNRWDHLHLRGEHMPEKDREMFSKGSPPLTWRTQIMNSIANYCNRITSTYVENTKQARWAYKCCWDHLHLRGEHGRASHCSPVHTGSPPLTWRTPIEHCSRDSKIRITSTYVENTCLFLL